MIIVFLAASHDNFVKFESLIVIVGIVRHSLLGVENAVAIFRGKMATLHPYMCKVRDVEIFIDFSLQHHWMLQQESSDTVSAWWHQMISEVVRSKQRQDA